MRFSIYLIPAVAAAALSGFLKEYLLTFFALLLHELGHLYAVNKRTVEISYIKAEPFGIRIKLSEDIIKNPYDEIIIAMAGPMTSISLGILFHIFYMYAPDKNILYFAYSNYALGIFNLLPVYPGDGGRILRAYLSLKTGYIKSYNTVRKITSVLSVILIITGIYIVYITKFNYTICLNGCFLYYGILTEKNHSAYYLNKELSAYKTKNADIEKIPVTRIAVNKNFKARNILMEMSFGKYCIAEIIDGYKKIGELTEGELLKAMLELGSDVKIKDIMKKGCSGK